MSSYNPPTENLPTFNSTLFNQPEVNLSQAEADLLYLSKTKSDTSTAPQTTFTGQLLLNSTSVNVLTPTLNMNYTGAVSISAPNATGLTMFSGYNTSASLFQNFNTGTITLGDAGFPGGTINLSSSVRLRNQIILHKKRIISVNTTLTFPIEETCQITATGNITITLPLCQYGDFVDGLIFKFVKTTSITNSITFQVNTTGGTNFIYAKGSVIPATPTATNQVLLVNANTSTTLVVLFNTPYFIWTEI